MNIQPQKNMIKKNIQELVVTGGVVFTGITAKTAHYVYNYKPETKIVERKKEDIIETDFDLNAIKLTGEAIDQPQADVFVPPLTNFISGNELAQPIAMTWDGDEIITHQEFQAKLANIELEGQNNILIDEYSQLPEIRGESNLSDVIEEELDPNSIQFAIAEDSLQSTEMETTAIKPFMQLASLQGEKIIETTTNTTSPEIVSTSNLIELDYASSENTLKDIFKAFTDAQLDVSGWYLSDVNGLSIENEEWVTSLDEETALAITFKNSSDEKSHWLISHSEGIDWEKVEIITDILEKYNLESNK